MAEEIVPEKKQTEEKLHRYILGQEHLAHEHHTHWKHNQTCSHCGSITPELFFATIKAGSELEATDHSWKVHIILHKDTGHLPHGHHEFHFQHLSYENKLYFIHELNAGRILISEHGHFHVLPFFIIDTLAQDSKPSI